MPDFVNGFWYIKGYCRDFICLIKYMVNAYGDDWTYLQYNDIALIHTVFQGEGLFLQGGELVRD